MKQYCMLLVMILILTSAIPLFAQDSPSPAPSAKPSPGKKGAAPASISTEPPKTNSSPPAALTPKPSPPPKRDSLESLRLSTEDLHDRLDRQEKELKVLQDTRSVTSEETPAQPDTLGPLGFFTSPLVFWTAALLFMAALVLHAVHLLKSAQTSHVVGQLWNLQQRSASASRAAGPGKNSAIESLTEQVRQQGQGLSQFTTQLSQLQNNLAVHDKQVADTLQAVALTANWVGQSQFREATTADGGHVNEADRASAIALLERYEEPLRVNAGRVEPLAQAMAALVEKLETEPRLPQELVGRAQSLHQEIGQFDLWQTSTNEQLASLRRGSFSKRSGMLQADQQRLVEQVNAGGISIAQMVHKSRELLDHHFPPNAQKNLTRLPSAEDEIEFKTRVASAPESLMDWFDSFSQFQNQVLTGKAARVPLDADIMSRLVQIQMLAREILSKFDIQPEEIQVGRTGYDRRLHEASLVRQSAQFPINTVIEVLRCGFRRMSNGEVLRRPQVVVAGAAAS